MNTGQHNEITKHAHKKSIILVVIIGIVITALSIMAVINREWLRDLEEYGYLGVFLVNVISSAALIVPGPSIIVVLAMGSVLNPFIVGAIAGLGEGVGALASYSLGYHGRIVVMDSINSSDRYHKVYTKIEKWMKYHGELTLFISSAVVNPLFAPIGMAAAAVRYPRWKYFLICWGGRTVKGIIIALIGSVGIKAILHLIGLPV